MREHVSDPPHRRRTSAGGALRKLLVGGAIVLALLVAVVWTVGSRVPRDHVATVRTELRAEPEAVWALVSDVSSWDEWCGAVDSVERVEDVGGRPTWVLHGSFGPLPAVVEEIVEGADRSSMTTRIPEDAGLGFHGTWSYAVTSRPGGGSVLETTESGTISGPFLRFFSAVFLDEHESQIAFARDLGERLGEQVEPRPID